MTSSDIHVAVNGLAEFPRTWAIDWLVRFPGEVRPRWQREGLSSLRWLGGGCMAPQAGVLSMAHIRASSRPEPLWLSDGSSGNPVQLAQLCRPGTGRAA